MYSPSCQYSETSSELTASYARPLAASMSATTSSKRMSLPSTSVVEDAPLANCLITAETFFARAFAGLPARVARTFFLRGLMAIGAEDLEEWYALALRSRFIVTSRPTVPRVSDERWRPMGRLDAPLSLDAKGLAEYSPGRERARA